MKKIPILWWIYGAEVLLFTLLVSGVVPRECAWVLAALLIGYSFWAPLEDGIVLFVMSIPLFIALPITSTFDNFNTWRIVSLVLFIRFALQARPWPRWRTFQFRKHPIATGLLLLLLLAALSLIGSQYPIAGMKRIIYFVNLSFVPFVLWALVQQGKLAAERVIRAIAIPTLVVVGAGFVQVISTYCIDIYQFMRLWGERIQLVQFGTQWSYIATQVGNTWFAYYGEQLSLRVFSLFPDSHSFPTFVLLGIPALLAIDLRRKKLWLTLTFLIVILSGTRGIWAAAVGIVALIPVISWLLRRLQISTAHRVVFRKVGVWIGVFFLLFAIAWPIFISPQFLVSKGDWGLLANRIRSVIDFGETSNSQRIAIWHASLVSIGNNPILGVGIGNFPVVLGQDILLARAGSTAHNLYLHVAAEMGIIAALAMIALLAHAWWTAWKWFASATGPSLIYAAALLLVLPWVYLYVLTDPIVFDERVFLMFATTLALVWSHTHAQR
jgi:O-antigen ligase